MFRYPACMNPDSARVCPAIPTRRATSSECGRWRCWSDRPSSSTSSPSLDGEIARARHTGCHPVPDRVRTLPRPDGRTKGAASTRWYRAATPLRIPTMCRIGNPVEAGCGRRGSGRPKRTRRCARPCCGSKRICRRREGRDGIGGMGKCRIGISNRIAPRRRFSLW